MDPNGNIRKPLRARKTMTPSSRKQVEILKNLNGLRKAGSDTNFVVNSEIRIYDSPDASRGLPFNGCDTGTEEDVFNPGSLQDLLLSLFQKESHSPISKPVEVHIYSKPNSQPSDSPEEQTSSLAPLTSDTSTSGKTEKAEELGKTEKANHSIRILGQEHDSVHFLGNDTLRERRTPGGQEGVDRKHLTPSEVTSATQSGKSYSVLEKVRGFVQSCTDHSVAGLDRKLQQLNERIDHTQCLRKHEGVTIQIVKKISRLDRHLNSAVDFQRTQLSKRVNLPGTQQKVTILNVNRTLPGSSNVTFVPPKRRSLQPGEVPSKAARSSAKEVCLNVDTSGNPARNSTEDRQKAASSNTHTTVEAPCPPKTKCLIDLTEDEGTNPVEVVGKEQEVSVKTNPPPESTMSTTTPQASAETTEKIPVQFPHLPPLPKIRLHPEHMNGFKGTLPPQKLDLVAAQVQDPKGVALRWNIQEADPRCAPIRSFHLFLCHETKNVCSPWTNVGEIKAMPLPMACTLSRFTSGNCYFAVQSKDIYGRFGPFCDIQAIFAL